MIIGRFYFRLTENGNLIGEFSNQTSLRNRTESADRMYGDPAMFTGDFLTTWLEEDVPVLSNLNISHKAGTTNIFSLSWVRNGTQSFIGEAIIAGGLLIGDYRDMDVRLGN
jgi:hypothetical protein